MSETKITHNQVIIFHDETKNVPGQGLKGHVLLFVPTTLTIYTETPLFGPQLRQYAPQDLLCHRIAELREQFACHRKLHFTRLSGRTWKTYDNAHRGIVEAAIDSLRSKSPQVFPYPLHCKLAVMFYPQGADWTIYGGSRKEQKLRHDETILRMLLKGAAHYLYDDRNLVEVTKIVSDGDPNHRPLDNDRVFWRLMVDELHGRTPLRDYVSFSADASIQHLPSDHNDHVPGTAEFQYANLLQVADFLLGSVMHVCYGECGPGKVVPRVDDVCVKRDVIAYPVLEMLAKKKRGAGFRNSGHYRAFTISEVSFEQDGVTFREIEPEHVAGENDATLQQFRLFGDSDEDS